MSRSNPTSATQNPTRRYFEWAAGKDDGFVRYYDKTDKANVKVASPFTFILLDELASVKGWHEPSESSIYSNEVRDTRQEALVVKSFKGGELASGFYAAIRDRIKAVGGHFTASLYIAYRDGNAFELGNIAFKGAALNAWVDFRKARRKEVYEQAVSISGFTDAKKGGTQYRVPVFGLKPVTPETDEAAITIDRELQEYLKAYLSRPKDEQVAGAPESAPPAASREALDEAIQEQYQAAGSTDEFDDPVPF